MKTRSSATLLAWLAGLAAAAALPAAPAQAGSAQDAWITTQVKLALLRADDVGGLAIDVDTREGLVTLHGLTAEPAERERARALARDVDGVDEVRDLLAVVPGSERERVADADAALRERLEATLNTDPELAGSSVDVDSIHDGIVVLEGRVDSSAAHLRAVEVARRVEGVRVVGSELRSPDASADRWLWREAWTSGAGEPDPALDAWIVGKAESLLAAITGHSPGNLSVDSHDGVVTLFGTVGSAVEKEMARVLVEPLAGVRAVRDELQVVPEPAARRRAAALDAMVAGAVRERLRQSPPLRYETIGVEVSNGVVHLTGRVEDADQKWSAVETAQSAEGVIRIVDGIRVRPPGRS